MTEIDSETSMGRSTGSERYPQGNDAPVTEEIAAWGLEIGGELATELVGRHLRTGPNRSR